MMNTKRKVGIVTLHGYRNYGNKLQNYALQKVLNSLGFLTDTVILRNEKTFFSTLRSKFKKLFHYTPSKLIYLLIEKRKQKLYNQENKKLVKARTNVFKQFSNDYLSERFIKIDKENLSKIIIEYDYFVTGSDQVWNPIYITNMDNYFLTFANKSQRIAYAPSFSCSKLPETYEKKYREWLHGMSKISVREKEGAQIIKELIGIDAPVLVDPTLLLSKEQWLSIANRAFNKPAKEYVLTYFLGEISEDIELYIQTVAKEKDMKIIRLGDIQNREAYVTGPREFIDYIDSSSILFTDSFHGVAFSILLEKPFVVYERKTKAATMYSRIETLLNKFKLKDREAKNISRDIFDIDYSHTYKILESERKKSLCYLKEALNIEVINVDEN